MYLILVIGILILVGYVINLKKTLVLQDNIIEEQKNAIRLEKLDNASVRGKLDFYYTAYVNLCNGAPTPNQVNEIKPIVPIGKEYELDEILGEISKRGIKNIDKNKLEFLKKFGKNDNKR